MTPSRTNVSILLSIVFTLCVLIGGTSGCDWLGSNAEDNSGSAIPLVESEDRVPPTFETTSHPFDSEGHYTILSATRDTTVPVRAEPEEDSEVLARLEVGGGTIFVDVSDGAKDEAELDAEGFERGDTLEIEDDEALIWEEYGGILVRLNPEPRESPGTFRLTSDATHKAGPERDLPLTIEEGDSVAAAAFHKGEGNYSHELWHDGTIYMVSPDTLKPVGEDKSDEHRRRFPAMAELGPAYSDSTEDASAIWVEVDLSALEEPLGQDTGWIQSLTPGLDLEQCYREGEDRGCGSVRD